jgi:hypothetical protein
MSASGALEKIKQTFYEGLDVFRFAFPHYERFPTSIMEPSQLG